MSENFSPYANFGYAAIKKQSAVLTSVIPDTWFRLMSQSMIAEHNNPSVADIDGNRSKQSRNTVGQIDLSGDIEFYLEPVTAGHFLQALYGAPTTQILSAGNAYRHTFELEDTPEFYTLDVKVANAPWVHRFYGLQLSAFNIEQDENKHKVTVTPAPTKAFISSRILTAANSGVAVALDQTSGLVVGDSILIIQQEDGFTTVQDRVIATIPTEKSITVTVALDAQIDVGDIVVIKKATQVYAQDPAFVWLGGSDVLIGDDIDNTSSVGRESMALNLASGTEPRFFAGKNVVDRMSGCVITKGYEPSGTLTRFHDTMFNIDRARANAQFGLRLFMQAGSALHANSAVKAKTFWGTGQGFHVEATDVGQQGNDYNVTIVVAGDDTLAAAISGKNVLISLANATSSKNTGTLIVALVDALTGVDSVVEGAGTEEFTVAVANTNLGDAISGATAPVVGRDASEPAYIQFDFAAAKIDPHFPTGSDDEVVVEDVPLKFYDDIESGDQKKNFNTKVRLVNDVSAY